MVRPARTVGCLAIAVLLLVVVVLAGHRLLNGWRSAPPAPGQQRCVATAGERSVSLDPEQAYFAGIIVGLSVKRGLPARAASIAIATAYQESGIRNLDYGDRDSVGLFQQRPSSGWGTVEQIMDPYYATGKFYDALVRIRGWQEGDINDVAQRIQISGHPEAYRDHVPDARVVASVLTGQSRVGFSCLDRSGAAGNARALQRSLTRTFGSVPDQRDGKRLVVDAGSAALAWAYAGHALAGASRYGVVEVVLGDRRWQTDDIRLPAWTDAPEPVGTNQVVVTVR